MTRLSIGEFASLVDNPKTRKLAIVEKTALDYNIKLARGETFNLQINENPSTGYQLILSDASKGTTYLVQSRFEEFNTFRPEKLVGAGGTRIYQIVGDSQG